MGALGRSFRVRERKPPAVGLCVVWWLTPRVSHFATRGAAAGASSECQCECQCKVSVRGLSCEI